jgi:hypothetical protein
MATLTLHQGNAQQAYEEHPIEVARWLLIAAARIESPGLAHQLRRFAEALPERGSIRRRGR